MAMIHRGRAFVNILTLIAVLALFLGLINISSITSAGGITLSLPVSPIILMIILALILIIDFAIFGGPWTPLYPLILGTLIFQNWIIGLLLGIFNAILLFTIGKLGRP